MPFSGRVMFFPTEIADAPPLGVVLPCRSQGELCFIPTETADAPLLGVVLQCRSQGNVLFSQNQLVSIS